MKINPLLYFAILFLSVTSAFAQKHTAVKGTVNSADGKPVESVTISITHTNWGTMTDANGVFQINKVKPGSYTIKATAIGLVPEEKQITVITGTETVVDFEKNCGW